jgi:hypothetical protein
MVRGVDDERYVKKRSDIENDSGRCRLGLATASREFAIANQSSTIDTTPARAFRGQHQPRSWPFDPAKLEGLSENLIRSHWENNYGGAAKALNAVDQRLAAMLKDKDLSGWLIEDEVVL